MPAGPAPYCCAGPAVPPNSGETPGQGYAEPSRQPRATAGADTRATAAWSTTLGRGNLTNRLRKMITGCHSHPMRTDETGVKGSVTDLAQQRWGVTLGGESPPRFAEPGWTYAEAVDRRCPVCGGELHALRRPYESQGRTYQYTALVCPACPAAFTLAELGVKRYDQLTDTVPRQAGPAVTVTVTVKGPGRADRGPAWPEDLAVPDGTERRALSWWKVADPAWRPADAVLAAAEDVRVILPEGQEYEALRAWLKGRGVPYRVSRYWEEAGQVGTVTDTGGRAELVAVGPDGAAPAPGPWAVAARDAFAAQWDALEELPDGDGDGYVPVGELVPAEWAGLLPHPSFNPVQAAAVPLVLEGTGHLVVVAPTGAGKTPIGMVAALEAHARGRKAAWLVPRARSPTSSTASSGCGAAVGCGWCV